MGDGHLDEVAGREGLEKWGGVFCSGDWVCVKRLVGWLVSVLLKQSDDFGEGDIEAQQVLSKNVREMLV